MEKTSLKGTACRGAFTLSPQGALLAGLVANPVQLLRQWNTLPVLLCDS
jgi:hypothetical protein